MSPPVKQNAVFVNIPYDEHFRRLYLAYIVGLTHLGLEPRATLGIPSGERRLDRILALIQSCRYSVHDLSRVQLDRTLPSTPRFNMPFELGLAVTWAKLHHRQHDWIVFEARARRVQKSLSDLDGSDPHIHGGTVEGVMREICNAFVRARTARPTVPEMMRTYRGLSRKSDAIIVAAGARSVFEARTFSDLCFAAKAAITHPQSFSKSTHAAKPRPEEGGGFNPRTNPLTRILKSNPRGEAARGGKRGFQPTHKPAPFFPKGNPRGEAARGGRRGLQPTHKPAPFFPKGNPRGEAARGGRRGFQPTHKPARLFQKRNPRGEAALGAYAVTTL